MSSFCHTVHLLTAKLHQETQRQLSSQSTDLVLVQLPVHWFGTGPAPSPSQMSQRFLGLPCTPQLRGRSRQVSPANQLPSFQGIEDESLFFVR